MKRIERMQNGTKYLMQIASIVMLTVATALFAVGCGQQAATTGDTGGTAGTGDQQTVTATQMLEVRVEIDASRAVPQGWTDSSRIAQVELKDGATAYDALVATGVSIEGEPSYVTGIDGLSAGAYGTGSGWLYAVNGEMPSVAADQNKLTTGDTLTWTYTVDMGNDL